MSHYYDALEESDSDDICTFNIRDRDAEAEGAQGADREDHDVDGEDGGGRWKQRVET